MYIQVQIFIFYVDCTMVQLHWSQWDGFFYWINVFENTLISSSRLTPENVYLD